MLVFLLSGDVGENPGAGSTADAEGLLQKVTEVSVLLQ